MTDTLDIAWAAIRALRTAAYRLQDEHQDEAGEDLIAQADALADSLMTTRA
jgi:predicted HAD superfamily Cof-like phosphohydrolase